MGGTYLVFHDLLHFPAPSPKITNIASEPSALSCWTISESTVGREGEQVGRQWVGSGKWEVGEVHEALVRLNP